MTTLVIKNFPEDLAGPVGCQTRDRDLRIGDFPGPSSAAGYQCLEFLGSWAGLREGGIAGSGV